MILSRSRLDPGFFHSFNTDTVALLVTWSGLGHDIWTISEETTTRFFIVRSPPSEFAVNTK